MWFPGRFLEFLPGWIVNAARIFHSYEARSWRWGSCSPCTTSTHTSARGLPRRRGIFSGNIPLHEIRERYPGWYRRVAGTDQVFRARTGTSRTALLISGFYLSVGFVILMLVMTTAALRACATSPGCSRGTAEATAAAPQASSRPMIPLRIAYFHELGATCIPGLRMRFARCACTVLIERNSVSAISRFVWPSAMSLRISRSRSLSVSNDRLLALRDPGQIVLDQQLRHGRVQDGLALG